MTQKTHSPQTCLIIGCGKLGQSLAIHLDQQGHYVTAVSRSPKNLPDTITHLCADVHHLNWADTLTPHTFDWVYIILAPSERMLMDYHHTYIDSISHIVSSINVAHRIVLVSSTRVYGSSNNTEVITDDSLLSPSDSFGQILQASELLWRSHFKDKLIIIRPSGLIDHTIYTKGRLYKMAQDKDNFTAHWVNLTTYQTTANVLSLLPDTPSHTLKQSYIINELSILKYQLLTAIAYHYTLCTSDTPAPQTLSQTGKQLYPTHLTTLLNHHNIKPKHLL